MKINELLLEISAGEARRRKKAAAEDERKRQQALAKAEQEKLVAKARKKIQKAVITPTVAKNEPVPAPTTKFLGVELDPKLQYDPKYDVEGTEDIGVYLKFHREKRNSDVFAYYSKYSYISWAGAQEYVPPPIVPLGKRFNGTKFKNLINKLVTETSTPTKAGYVNIVISENDLQYKDGDRFFTEMLMWLRINYPQTGEEMDATVYWELV